jgi:hypothetical protein
MTSIAKGSISLLLTIMLASMMVWSCSKKSDGEGTFTTDERGTVYEQVGHWEKGGNRIYTVCVIELDWVGMNVYAERKPHRAGRTTSVLFFNDRTRTPDVTRYGGSMRDVIDRIYADGDSTCWIARYDRWPSGESVFTRYPAR